MYKSVPVILEDAENELSPSVRRSISRRLEEIRAKEEQIAQVEHDIQSWFQTQPGARSVLKLIERYKENMPWLHALSQRKHHNVAALLRCCVAALLRCCVAAVAQVTKTARVLWAMLTKGTEYKIRLTT